MLIVTDTKSRVLHKIIEEQKVLLSNLYRKNKSQALEQQFITY